MYHQALCACFHVYNGLRFDVDLDAFIDGEPKFSILLVFRYICVLCHNGVRDCPRVCEVGETGLND